jgi:8-oxo-dGTP pyrophosphatase MutT (NUDIX family)
MDYLNLLAPHRHGEVAMIIERSPGWVLLQTKANYPPGTFRIPTGTICKGEPPEDCMRRELMEEANLTPGRSEELFQLVYNLKGARSGFTTFGYLIQEPAGELMPIDKKEAITGWREAQLAELPDVARDLRRLEAPRAGWGLFRSAIHQLLAQIMLKK